MKESSATRLETIAGIEAELRRLATQASDCRQDMLTYLIEMAAHEAAEILRRRGADDGVRTSRLT